MNMEKIAKQLYDKLSHDVSPKSVVVIDCGHFDSVTGIDEFSIATTQLASVLFEKTEDLRRKGLKIVFAVLIDDVGMTCDTDAMVCLPKDSKVMARPTIPNAIYDILKTTTGFRDERLKLFSEKTARNRGIQFYRKHLDEIQALPKFFIETSTNDSNQLLFENDQGQRVLVADLTTDSLWTGHCPLLMAMHYRDIATWASKLFADRTAVHIIDFSLSQDRGKVNSGAQIATAYAPNSALASITNLCSADEELDVYSMDSYSIAGSK